MATQQHGYAIDTHVHVFRRTAPWMAWLEDRPQRWDAVRRDFAWAHLTAVLDESGIDDLVLVQAGMTPDESVELLQLAAEQPRVRGVVGWVTLGSPRETEIQLDRLAAFQQAHAAEAPAMLQRLRQAVIDNQNVFAVLMDAVRVCSLGQITHTLFEVGGQYRRNM